MNVSSLLQLLSLAAIWGGSFLFMRMGATVLSPAVMIEARVFLAAVFLLMVALLLKKRLPLRAHWKHFLVLGLFNSALPFLLLGWSAKTLTASMLSILNATAPIWGALIGVLCRQIVLTARSMVGLTLGISGVVLLVGLDDIVSQTATPLAIIAALGAGLSYGIASTYARNTSASVSSFDNAHGSMWAATLLIVPLLPFSPVSHGVSTQIVGAVVLLGVICTGVAYLLYFKLVADLGAPSALTVTFLVPVFGILWGHLLLGEAVGWHMLFGALLVVTGTALVTGFSARGLFRTSKTAGG